MNITELKINGITNPIGFSFDRVVCSWKVVDTKAKKQKQTIIEVSDSPSFETVILTQKGDDLASNETELVLELQPCTTYYWRVRVTADNGECAVSEPASFETGNMQNAWRAEWIAPQQTDSFHPVFTKKFEANGKVARARMYICGLGLYEAYLNGEKVGSEYLTPYLNDYLESYQYQTYDITGMVKANNQVEILLGKGWYMGVFGLQNKDRLFGDRMKVIAELRIWYTDGRLEVVATDGTWSYRGSDIEESGIYFGETINRLLWDKKENPLKPAEVLSDSEKPIERFSLPVVEKETLTPVAILTTPSGDTVVDFGQNHAGFMEFYADFPRGTKVTFECAEVLLEGNFYHDNYRDAKSVFTYISDGTPQLVRPHFTYFGYRYLRVSGWPGTLKKEDIWAKVIYSDLARTGFIETSNEKLNRLYQNSLWGLKSNFIDLPTDCPQRSERLGWTGDAQVFAPTASYHMDTRAFYRKFLRDLRSEQVRADGAVPNFIPSLGETGATSVWGDVATFLPHVLYQAYGNLADAKRAYPLMRDWVEYMYRNDEEHGGRRFFLAGFQFGDWLALDGVTPESFKGSTDDTYIGIVYYYQSTKITADMAKRLGYEVDAKKYERLAQEIRSAILNEYFTPNGRLAADTQASYIVALKFGLYTDREKLIAQFRERLKKDCYQIKCGFVGAPLLCMVLCENGMEDLAYHFLFQEGFPSWLYAVNMGATTVWERWNSILEDGSISKTGMNSLNHYAYGSVVEFFYAYIAGIRPAKPGYRRAVIAPLPSMRFRYFNCSYNSACGMYVSNWNIARDGIFSLHVEIPFGCVADVTLPRCDGSNVTVIGDAPEISKEGTLTLDAGVYEFSYMPTRDYRKVYDENTRLSEVEADEEVMALLKEELPVAYGIITGGDKENRNLTFGELKYQFFMGFTPELVEKTTAKIFAMKRW
jgi:alpha-L-rhamnosidase